MKLTDNAITQINSLNKDNKYLRLSVVGGGCSGLSYKMEFTDIPNTNDNQLTFNQVNVLVDPKSWLFLKDIEIDFESGLNGKGFTYINPLAARNCGCGSSFSPT